MNSRERVVKALNHEEPDRVPVDVGGTTNTGIMKRAHDELKQYLNFSDGETELIDVIQQLAKPDQRIMKKFGADVRGIFAKPPLTWEPKITEDDQNYYYIDEWGIKYRMPKKHGHYFDIIGHPLANATLESLRDYQWPNPLDPGRTKGLKEEIVVLYKNTDFALFANIPCDGIFEQSWSLRGFDKICMDLILNPKLVEAILDRILEFYLGYWENVLSIIGEYVQVVKVNDDMGDQRGLLISPDLYRRFIKPRDKELISFIKKRTNAKVYLHSCGAVSELIPDYVECGVDVLNPIQVSAKGMNTEKLKQQFGNRISFWGAIDTQKVLPFGTRQDVKEEVRRRIHDLASGGGYILASVHNIQNGVPPQNIITIFEAARKYGGYPLEV